MSQKTLEHSDQTRTDSPTTIQPTNHTVPETLDSTGSKLVYLYLDSIGGGDISVLRESLDMKTISIYPILQTLSKKGLVERDGDHYHIVA